MQQQTVDLGFRPRDWQAVAFKKLKKRSVLVVHRRGGKTVMAIMLLVDRALKCKVQMGLYGYIAPQLNQGKAIAWELLKHYARAIPGTQINEAECWVKFPNKVRIRIYGADDPDKLRGLGFCGVVMDEVAQMRPELWGEIVQPALADHSGWALFIGTPKGINLFSELFYRAKENPDWHVELLTVNDTDALPPEEIEKLRGEMTEAQFRQEMLCDFAASSEDTLLPIPIVEEAMQRHYDPKMLFGSPRVLGVDVARQGDDRTVIFKRQGKASFTPKVMKGADSMAVAAAVATLIDEWGPDAVFVDGSGGYGAGVIDRLRQLGYDVVEVQFGGSADDARFVNKRSEMWWRMAEWVKGGGALPHDVSLKTDLCAPTYSNNNAANKLALESKDAIKKRISVSPDMGDALALTFAYPVSMPELTLSGERLPNAVTGKALTDYSPFERAGL